MNEYKILIVDDDVKILSDVGQSLAAEGYLVRTAENAETALKIADQIQLDLTILDIALPDEYLKTGERADGLTILRKLRQKSTMAILMLSSSSLSSLKVLALDTGADDYLTKPYDAQELLARVKALLRRSSDRNATEPPQEFRHIRIDVSAQKVWKQDEIIHLTPIEYEILLTLSQHAGRVMTRRQIIDNAWEDKLYGDERVVDTHIASLRKKIEIDSARPTLIVSVRGRGYRFDR